MIPLLPIDIEAELQAYLADKGYNCAAVPLPRNFDSNLPFVLIERVGGRAETEISLSNQVAFDVYAETFKSATETANALSYDISQLVGGVIGERAVYNVEISALPYNNPDDRHPTTPRVTLSLLISLRGR